MMDRGAISIELSGLDPEAVNTVDYALDILAKHGVNVWEPIPGDGYLLRMFGSDPEDTKHVFYIIGRKDEGA